MMTQSVTETGGFTQDLFSPLQFCEVIDEGQRQQLSHVSTLPISNVGQPNSNTQQSTQTLEVKQETVPQPTKLTERVNNKSEVVNPITSMDILITGNPGHLPVTSSNMVVGGYQQENQISHLYQVQHLQMNSVQLQQSNSEVSMQSQQKPPQDTQPNIIETTSYTPIPLNEVLKEKTLTNAVGTQTTPLDTPHKDNDDEPEIIFTNLLTNEASPALLSSSANDSECKHFVKQNENTKIEVDKVKPIPIKKTWRRPWKKKKEREKRQPVKKARRVKRRRIVIPKRNIIHIDSRNGPRIDTSNTLVMRESEESINQLKQKRQRIKLNRNSGREYVNRLGKIVRARKIGSPCNCPLKCWDRMGSKILEIFNNFWDLCDFNLQNSYLFTCLKLCDVKRRYTKKPAEESRRQNTFEYFVRISGKHLRVCKKAFMSSHGLTSDKRLRTLFHQMKDGALIPEPDRRGKHHRPSKSQMTQNHHNHLNNDHHSKTKTKVKISRSSNKKSQGVRLEANKQAVYAPPTHPMGHLHPHCTPPPPAHAAAMQEPPHAYIPNGEIYFPGHYLEPPQSMAPHHMNQIPSCQKMLEAPAYFMAGMKENTFHQ